MPEPTATTRAIVRNMRALRHQRGWSAQRLADELTAGGYTISRDQLGNQESGRTQNITADQLLALARVFGVSIDALTTASTCPTCGQVLPTTETETS